MHTESGLTYVQKSAIKIFLKTKLEYTQEKTIGIMANLRLYSVCVQNFLLFFVFLALHYKV